MPKHAKFYRDLWLNIMTPDLAGKQETAIFAFFVWGFFVTIEKGCVGIENTSFSERKRERILL